MTIVRLAPAQARQIALRSIKDWGERGKYHVTPEELRILINAKARVIALNQWTDDQLWSHEVEFMNRCFRAITPNQIAI